MVDVDSQVIQGWLRFLEKVPGSIDVTVTTFDLLSALGKGNGQLFFHRTHAALFQNSLDRIRSVAWEEHARCSVAETIKRAD